MNNREYPWTSGLSVVTQENTNGSISEDQIAGLVLDRFAMSGYDVSGYASKFMSGHMSKRIGGNTVSHSTLFYNFINDLYANTDLYDDNMSGLVLDKNISGLVLDKRYTESLNGISENCLYGDTPVAPSGQVGATKESGDEFEGGLATYIIPGLIAAGIAFVIAKSLNKHT